ncbi:heme ABC transporter ATP-binding protein [Dietzia timorensis]|uniref:Hemin import ATP-binding protein HmuV n=1 Tax=Dietzia timorensis TaxID=499555 RepID=A0A173LI07_9ACTN|nr:heme ABC transporter ATP-binding protein [Dietzia timorensis]ANI91234.1 Hemin import ATP-binding protein HmuV [Dietzia timorensis]
MSTENRESTTPGTTVLEARSVVVTAGKKTLVDGVDLQVRAGEVLGLIGPNGAGKSTLLSALAGDRPPHSGSVELFGRPYSDYSPRQAARLRAVMLQDPTVSFAHLVRDVVEMGRAAWPGDPDRDAQIIDRCLAEVDMTGMADREITTLSGGERARVALARVLAQTADCVMLDEPTAAMDIGHSERTMHTVRRVAGEGAGVVVVLHDLGTAAKYCDRLALLHAGRIFDVGTPEEVCTEDTLSHVYGWPISVTHHPATSAPGTGHTVADDGGGANPSGGRPVLWIRPRDERRP